MKKILLVLLTVFFLVCLSEASKFLEARSYETGGLEERPDLLGSKKINNLTRGGTKKRGMKVMSVDRVMSQVVNGMRYEIDATVKDRKGRTRKIKLEVLQPPVRGAPPNYVSLRYK
jgi:hypothetical protein